MLSGTLIVLVLYVALNAAVPACHRADRQTGRARSDVASIAGRYILRRSRAGASWPAMICHRAGIVDLRDDVDRGRA